MLCLCFQYINLSIVTCLFIRLSLHLLAASVEYDQCCLLCCVGDNGVCKGVWPRSWSSNCSLHHCRGKNLLLLQRGWTVVHMRWYVDDIQCFVQCLVFEGSRVSDVIVSGLSLFSSFYCRFKFLNLLASY